jgi:hypothetical protein
VVQSLTARDVPPRLPRRLHCRDRSDAIDRKTVSRKAAGRCTHSSGVSGYVTAAGRRRCPADVLDDGAVRRKTSDRCGVAGRLPRRTTYARRWDGAIARLYGRRRRRLGRKEQYNRSDATRRRRRNGNDIGRASTTRSRAVYKLPDVWFSSPFVPKHRTKP